MEFMDKSIIEEIEDYYSKWKTGEIVGRLAYLRGVWNRLNYLASQLKLYLRRKGRPTPEERKIAEQLLEMIQSVEAEGQQLQRELSNEAYQDLLKFMTQL